MSDPLYLTGAKDAGSDTTEESTLEFIFKRLMNRRTHAEFVRVVAATALPGDSGPVGNVDVLPLINQIDGYGNARPHEVVSGLSVFRYAAGRNRCVMNPVVNDIGIAIVADRDPSVVKATLDQGNPGSNGWSRREYGIYFGLALGNDDAVNEILFGTDGIVMNTGTAGLVVNGATITQDGRIFDVFGIELGAHVHGGVTHGSDDSGPPVA